MNKTFDERRTSFEHFLRTGHGKVSDHQEFIHELYSNAIELDCDYMLTDLANAWLGNIPQQTLSPIQMVFQHMESAHTQVSGSLTSLWLFRIPEVLTEGNGWISEGPRYAFSLEHPVTGEHVPALQNSAGWLFLNKEQKLGLNITVDRDGCLRPYVYFDKDVWSLDAAVVALHDLIEKPNPYQGQICRLTDHGLHVVHMHDEKITGYSEDIENAVSWLTKIAEEPVRERLRDAGLPTRAGLLLEGPPGSGKTTLVRRVARELKGKATVLYVDASVSAADALGLAEVFHPAMFIFEDVEGFIGERGDGSFSDFLNAVDGLAQDHATMLLATTNDSSQFDDAVRRPGRLERRAVILGIHPDAKVNMLSSRFPGEDPETIQGIMAIIEERIGEVTKVTPAVIDSLARHAIMLDLSGTAIADYARNEWHPTWHGESYIE